MSKRKVTSNEGRIKGLIEEVRAGDQQAFSRLIRQVEPYIYSVSMKVCRDRAVADENTQDTFVSMYRKLDQFDGASKFTTWLYMVIVNNCRMKRRRRKIDQAMVPMDDGPDYERVPDVATPGSEAPDRGLLNQELHAVLELGMQRLTPEQREVFALRDLENMSAEETAATLGITVPAVKSRLHRARLVLREELQRYFNPEAESVGG